ncbi:hypothetical protein Glove_490g33 [Diversispora epigaea]|uniref:Protein kinase domain-containing protein n=1 Tax=Diversispora epigaea TaxID=1348612 RepID=A0A397GIR8_9GLOM|nr:hypothetical protein Glove_490g33 [Diversispora epigaea]
MTTVEEMREQLALIALAKFEEGKGNMLEKLRGRLLNREYKDEKERELWIKEKDELASEYKRLAEMKDYWERTDHIVQHLSVKFTKMTTVEEMREQLALIALAKFEEGKGNMLEKLRGRLLNREYKDEKERELWIKEKDELASEYKRLAEMKDYWERTAIITDLEIRNKLSKRHCLNENMTIEQKLQNEQKRFELQNEQKHLELQNEQKCLELQNEQKHLELQNEQKRLELQNEQKHLELQNEQKCLELQIGLKQKCLELQVEQEKIHRIILDQERKLERGSMTCSQLYQSTKCDQLTIVDFLRWMNVDQLKSLPNDVSTYLNMIDKPKPNQGKTKMQNWFNDLVKILNKIWKVHAIDTHNNPYLNGLEPDISIFDSQNLSGGTFIPMFVQTVLELKQQKSETSNLNNEDKGQLIDYIQILTQQQPLRRFFLAFLSDASNFYVMVYDRNNKQYSEYSTTFTEGIRLFFTILDIESVLLNLNMPNLNSTGIILRRFLGQGLSGLVYAIDYKNSTAVVKIALDGCSSALKQEHLLLLLLNEHNVPNIPICIGLDGNMMLMQPVCTRIDRNFQRHHAHGLLDLLKHIHEIKIIHRDVQPSNIMMDPQGNVILIDWGSALKLTGLTGYVDYEGTITYASPAILKNNLERHIPQISDDLHSFIRTMFKLLHPTFKLDIDRTVKSIENFWNKAFSSVFWKDMVNAADKCQYDDLKQDYPYMKNFNYNGSTEYEKAIRFLEIVESNEWWRNTASRRLKKKTRIGRTYLENIRNHLATNVKNFLENYAEILGLSSPGRNVNRITQSLTLLPAETSYKSVYRDFIAGLENDSTLKLLKYDAFRKLWLQLTPYIQIMSPRTDLCDMCQNFRNGLQYNARKEEAKDLLKKYKEHLVKAKLERNYYNKNTKLAEQQRKLVDENYLAGGKADYYSLVRLLITVTFPILINLSPRKVRLFDIQDEAVREQINYILDEDEIIGKGPNVTLSMVFDGIKRLKNCVYHVVKVVKKSSTAGLKKAQCYENGKAANLGVVKAQMVTNGARLSSSQVAIQMQPIY